MVWFPSFPSVGVTDGGLGDGVETAAAASALQKPVGRKTLENVRFSIELTSGVPPFYVDDLVSGELLFAFQGYGRVGRVEKKENVLAASTIHPQNPCTYTIFLHQTH